MTDGNTKRRIGQSLDRTLSGLRADPLLSSRVLRLAQERKGEEKVVKKLSGAVIFAIILVLLMAAAALALTNWEQLKAYFETVRTMDTSGELARWSDEDKIKLLRAMQDAGIAPAGDERVQTALDESLPLAVRGAAADAVIAGRYGENYFDSYTVEDLELPKAALSADEQADYAAWSEDFWAQWSQREKQPLTEGRAYNETMSNLTERGDFPRELMRDVAVSYAWDEAAQHYIVTASIGKDVYQSVKRGADEYSVFDWYGYEQGDALCFQFYVDKYGAYLGSFDPYTPENRAEWTLEDALPIARDALTARLGITPETLDELTLDACYAEGHEYELKEGRFRAVCGFTWRNQAGEALYNANIDAKTGRVVSAFDWRESNAMRDKERAWIAQLQALIENAGASGTLLNEEGQYFWYWTLDEKAAWSRIARPVAQQFLADNAQFARYLEDMCAGRYSQRHWDNLISLTQYAYGMPDAAAITREAAFAIAREAALAQGAKQSYIDENTRHDFLYDVTAPARPVWKVTVQQSFGDNDPAHPYDPTAPCGYFAVIDAHTGELLRVTPITVNTCIRDIV